MTDKHNIYAAIPTRGEPPWSTMQAIYQAMAHEGITNVDMSVAGFSVCEARNAAVLRMLQNESTTHLLMVDEDVVPPRGFVRKLLECDSGVASGCVPTINFQQVPYVVVAQGISGNHPTWYGAWFKGIRETPLCGAACMLIQRHVLEKVCHPWFQWSRDHDWYAPQEGEDAFFCRRVREEGLGPIKAHGDVRCQHRKVIDCSILISEE